MGGRLRLLGAGALVGGALGWLTCLPGWPMLVQALGFVLLVGYAAWTFRQVGLFRPLPPAPTRTESVRRFVTSSWFWTLGLAPFGWLSEATPADDTLGLLTLGAGVLLALWWLLGRRTWAGPLVWLAFVGAVQLGLDRLPLSVRGEPGVILASAYGALVGVAAGLLSLGMSPHASRAALHTALAALLLALLVGLHRVL